MKRVRSPFSRVAPLGAVPMLAMCVAAHAQSGTPPPAEPAPAVESAAPESAPADTAAEAPAEPAAAASDSLIEEVIITSQKRAENLQDVPIAVSALSASQLANAGIQGQVDLPKLTPNLNFTVNSGFASAYIRGVGTQYGNPGLEPSVSVYLDDTYIPRAGSALFSFADISRIEVLKGPQGTLYGRNATGGAIRIITNDPVDRFEAKGALTYGSFDTIIASGMLNQPLSEGIALRLSAQHEQNDGYVDNDNPGGDAAGHKKGQNRNTELYTAKLLMDQDGPFKFTLSADYSRKDDRESVSEANLFPGGPEQIGAVLGGCVSDGFYSYCNDGRDQLKTQAYGSTARLDYDAGPVTLSSITGYRRENERNCADIDGTGAFVQHVCGRPTTKQITEELQVASNGTGPLRYVAGVYYLREESGYAFTVTAAPFPPGFGLQSNGDNIRVHSVAPFAQIDYDFTEQWALSLGARYTQESKRLTESVGYITEIDPNTGFPKKGGTSFPSKLCSDPTWNPALEPGCVDPGKTADFNEFTYKATVSFTPVDNTLFYGTISRGFKSGGLNLPSFVAVDVVEPETLMDYELGWKLQRGSVRWNGSLFFYDYKDLQIAITDQTTGGTRIKNAASARMKGIESDVTWVVVRNFELGFGGSYLDAKYRDFRGDAYVPCGEVASLPTPDAESAAGVAAGLLQCAGNGGLGLALVSGQDLSGERLVNTPKWNSYFRAQYTMGVEGMGTFTLSGVANYRSVAYFDSANRFDDTERTLYSARLMWNSESDRYFASVYGENLGDKKYNLIKSPQATGGWRVAAPPRQVYGSVGMRF